MIAFHLTVPRRSGGLIFDTTGLIGNALTDVQQLNALLGSFSDNPAGSVSDLPGNDFRLELLIRTVRILLPKDDFIPARQELHVLWRQSRVDRAVAHCPFCLRYGTAIRGTGVQIDWKGQVGQPIRLQAQGGVKVTKMSVVIRAANGATLEQAICTCATSMGLVRAALVTTSWRLSHSLANPGSL